MASDTDDDFLFDVTDSTAPHLRGLKREISDIMMEDVDDETADDSDDDNCLDLTVATPQTISSSSTTTNGTPSSSGGTNTPNSISGTSRISPKRINTPNPLDMLVDDGISEDALVAMGIDMDEIRAQKEIERRFQMEAQQLEYAKQLQQQLNGDNHATEAAAWRNMGLGASTSTANGKAPMHSNVDHTNKRPRFTGDVGSSSAASTSAPVFTIDSDDDDMVDLTNDSDGGHGYERHPYGISYTVEDDDDDEEDPDDLLLPEGADLEAIMHQMYQIQQRREAERRYGITINPTPGNRFGDTKSLPFPYPNRQPGSSSSHPPSLSMADAEEQLRRLLENIADEEPPPPESRSGTPPGLTINLLEHQKIGFQWMCKQEVSSNKGGLLADDMGLGKTIQALSIMVARKCENPDPLPDLMSVAMQKSKNRIEPFKTKCNLVVCPVSLMEQWAQEIKSKSENMTVYIHHGTRLLQNPYEIAGFDVVITSYNKLRGEFPDEESEFPPGNLQPLIYHRVILDEAHSIKNRTTGAAKACYRIKATHRWCMTATPIQNKIEELYSLIKFLRIEPYCDWTNFREDIVSPLKSSYRRNDGMKKVQLIMKAISLRRSKKAEIDGRPILNLPERNVHFTHVDFPTEERRFYNFVDNKVQADFSDYVDAGTVMQNYSSVLVLLLRLRQACLHAALTTIEKPLMKNDVEKQMENGKALKQQVVDRLIGMKHELSSVECPICMDAANEPRVIAGCGHILCEECLSAHVNTSSDFGGEKTCPQCRGELRLDTTVPLAIFFRIHIPEMSKIEKKDPEVLEAEALGLQFESSMKIDTMLNILKETREETKGRDKTIVFSQFTKFLDLLERPLTANGIKFGRYDGSMSLRDRTEVIESYRNDPAMEVLLVSTKCGSLGLNLTMANRVILMDIWWNPALENQAIDRVHRIGQTKDVVVHRLFINNTVEDRILELQKRKQMIADGALGEGSAEKLGRLGLQDMLYLFRGGPPPPVPGLPGPSQPLGLPGPSSAQ